MLLIHALLVLLLFVVALGCFTIWFQETPLADRLKVSALGVFLSWAMFSILSRQVLPFATPQLAITLHEDYLEIGSIKGPMRLERSALSGCSTPAQKSRFFVARDHNNLVEIKLKKAHKLRNWRGQPVNPVFDGSMIKGETPSSVIRTIRDWRKNGLEKPSQTGL